MTQKTETSLEENDVVLCTIKRIQGTTVFLETENGIEGTMIFSEVSPGRIRNIRDYIAPNKKIVCKVLKIKDGHLQLSLRRVTAKERDEVLEQDKKEKILANIIKTVLKDKTPQYLEKIKKKYDLADFLDEARENSKILSEFFSKKEIEELQKIFAEKKEKEKSIKTQIKITSNSPSGIKDIKETLSIKSPNTQIYYLGSSKFAITVKSKDYKSANTNMEKILDEIKQKAKSKHLKLEIKEK